MPDKHQNALSEMTNNINRFESVVAVASHSAMAALGILAEKPELADDPEADVLLDRIAEITNELEELNQQFFVFGNWRKTVGLQRLDDDIPAAAGDNSAKGHYIGLDRLRHE